MEKPQRNLESIYITAGMGRGAQALGRRRPGAISINLNQIRLTHGRIQIKSSGLKLRIPG
ncbi:MAG: hypothetical protein ACOYMF_16650 [Bacteroidales bacterium]